MTLAEANLILKDLDTEGEAYDDSIDKALSQQELGKSVSAGPSLVGGM